ncbi:hypothetical protein SDJN03_11130, partial [Cucurbita argyrosperma subsp. sororia]
MQGSEKAIVFVGRENPRLLRGCCCCLSSQPFIVLYTRPPARFHSFHLTFYSRATVHMFDNQSATVATTSKAPTRIRIWMWLVHVAYGLWRSGPTHDLPKGTRPVFVEQKLSAWLLVKLSQLSLSFHASDRTGWTDR